MGAQDLLADLAGAGLSVEADGHNLRVRPATKLTDDLRTALRASKAELLGLLAPRTARSPEPAAQERPYELTEAEAACAHSRPWDNGAIARFVARVSLAMRRGISATNADDLAERLTLRDLTGEDTAMCLECRNLTGRTSAGWRCRTPKAAGVGAELPAELPMGLQRCPSFDGVDIPAIPMDGAAAWRP